ncbi:unnamed protein product [Owenia fusiformis]|uniref:Uncharacterized protein n=1 Tax=Owenia fusiformis TaxID=6347 RepID=A0A8J1Y077_OWEFU|nr:unnamed protein product [Owenia fusiformis]
MNKNCSTLIILVMAYLQAFLDFSFGRTFYRSENRMLLNVTHVIPKLSIEECAIYCESTSGCVQFNFRKSNGDDTCQLLSTSGTLIKNQYDYDLWRPEKPLGLIYTGCRGQFSYSKLRDNTPYDNLTLQGCVDDCRQKGKKFAGAYGGFRCLCGDLLYYATSNCTIPCKGNAAEICGGEDGQHLSTYVVNW